MGDRYRPLFDPEEEHGGIVSGQIRDFTRRYGMLTPSVEGELGGLREPNGTLWEPIDRSSVTAILFGGLRRVEPGVDTSSRVEDQ